MSAESDRTANRGIGGAYGWSIGGILSGLVGAVAFGLFLWLVDPSILRDTIPSLYGLDGRVAGWVVHLVQGAVLGLVFAFLVTRDAVLNVLFADVETEAISGAGTAVRTVGAGLTYALAVYTLFPLVAVPVFVGTAGTGGSSVFTEVAVEGLAGHAIFGVVLGAVFAVTVDVRAPSHGGGFEE